MRIDPLPFERLTPWALNDYMLGVVSSFLADPAVEQAMGVRLEVARDAFMTAVNAAAEAYGADSRAIDAKNDLFWRWIQTELRNNLNHPDDAVREASEEIDALFESWADPAGLKKEAKSEALEAHLAQLSAFGKEKLTRAQIEPWVKALQKGIEQLKAVRLEKGRSEAAAVSKATEAERAALLQTHDDIMRRLDAKSQLYPAMEFDQLITRINRKVAEAVRKI